VPHAAVPITCALFFATEPRNTFPLNDFRTLLRAMEGVPHCWPQLVQPESGEGPLSHSEDLLTPKLLFDAGTCRCSSDFGGFHDISPFFRSLPQHQFNRYQNF